MSKLKHHAYQFIIAIDQLLNVAALGWADETLSARCWRLRKKRFWGILYRVLDIVFFWDTKKMEVWPGKISHCEWAYNNENERAQLAPEYRK